MINNSNNKDIDPRLEKLLQDELTRRAKKIEAINKWKNSDDSRSSKSNRLRIVYASVSGIAAMLVVGFFLMGNYLAFQSSNPNLELDGVPTPAGCAAEPIFRGALIDPSIYNAIDEGDTIQAICLIDSAIQICQSNLHQLDSIASISGEQEEIKEMRVQTESELKELMELKNKLNN